MIFAIHLSYSRDLCNEERQKWSSCTSKKIVRIFFGCKSDGRDGAWVVAKLPPGEASTVTFRNGNPRLGRCPKTLPSEIPAYKPSAPPIFSISLKRGAEESAALSSSSHTIVFQIRRIQVCVWALLHLISSNLVLCAFLRMICILVVVSSCCFF